MNPFTGGWVILMTLLIAMTLKFEAPSYSAPKPSRVGFVATAPWQPSERRMAPGPDEDPRRVHALRTAVLGCITCCTHVELSQLRTTKGSQIRS